MSVNFGSKLISWYEQNKRHLPWRNTINPYKIWLSEIILQQTRIDQGLKYYLAFEERFPTVFSLAEASPKEVFKMWQGLGYYNRAENLMIAAKTIVEKYDGRFPEDPAELMNIKGIGSYTSAAIASLAFNVPIPVVDGNVFRVLSRIFGISTPINTTYGKKEFEILSGKLMSNHPPSVFNQAIMEFGALYCKPANPNCQQCIFIDECHAGKLNSVGDFPVKKPKAKIRNRHFYYFLIETKIGAHSQFILKRRQEKDIWKNLYDMPMAEYKKAIDPLASLESDNFKSLLGDSEYQINSIKSSPAHLLTHQRIHAHFIHIIVDNLPILQTEKYLLLVDQSQLINYPVPRLIERYLQDQKLI